MHAEEWVLFEKNIGAYVGIDEVCLSRGELYTILINKEKKGAAGSIIAIIKGTDVKTVTSILLKLSRRRGFQVREITLDMAPNMEQTARICFPAARHRMYRKTTRLPTRARKLMLEFSVLKWETTPRRSSVPNATAPSLVRKKLAKFFKICPR